MERAIRRFLKDFFNLDIAYDANHRIVNSLDVKLDLDTGFYCPFIKRGKTVRYINTDSNHPLSTVKGVINSISVKLLNFSTNKEIFERHAPAYNDLLRASSFKGEILYIQDTRFNSGNQIQSCNKVVCYGVNQCYRFRKHVKSIRHMVNTKFRVNRNTKDVNNLGISLNYFLKSLRKVFRRAIDLIDF